MITVDSRQVKMGDIFVAIKGRNFDGHDFIRQALAEGAKKVYGEIDYPSPNYQKVSNSIEFLGSLVGEYYKDPSSKITVIGVTGTKGKTTTCHLIHFLLTKSGYKTGLISTISTQGYHTTTPDIITLNQELSKMVNQKYKFVVLEVSSHGIDQGRVSGIKFDTTVLTNIAPEHLDYHGTFKEYKRVKNSFLKSGINFQVKSPNDTKLKILPGKFNNLNLEAAINVCSNYGIDRQKLLRIAKDFKLPEGRLQVIENNSGFNIYVDFAHTPESLAEVLNYLRQKHSGRLFCVFGCAGLRDVKKRMKMGQLSTKIADFSVFTTEDPRTEDMTKIFYAMKKKALGGKYVVIPQRSEAIAWALSKLKRGDTLAILGKGHEKTMCYETFEHPWSDQDFIKSQLDGIQDLSAIVLAAGRGKRMNSKLPKVLHRICGRPMIDYSFENLRKAGVKDLTLVVGFKRNLVLNYTSRNIKYSVQNKPMGTGHAALSGLGQILPNSKYIMVVNGDDSAFYTPQTIRNVYNDHIKKESTLTFVSLIQEDPTGLGRVCRDKKGKLIGIVEEKNASDDQRKIKEVNDGLYIFNRKWLESRIKSIKKDNLSGEFYLVDLIETALKEGKKVSAFKLPDSSEWQGVNTPEQLLAAENKMKLRIGL